MDSDKKAFIPVVTDGARQRPVVSSQPFDAHSPISKTGSAASRGSCCILSTCVALTLAISIAALALSAQVFWPAVWLSQEPSSPSGYYFGGAMYQGSGTWINKVYSALPSARSDLAAVAVGGKIYLLGGFNGTNVLDANLEFDTVFERYNASKAVMPRTNYRFAATAVGTSIITVGGMHELDGSGSPDAVAHAHAYKYDTVADVWSSLPDMPAPRVDCAAASHSSRVYVFGGYSPVYEVLSSVVVLDTTTGAWTPRADMPTKRGDLAAVTLGSRIFVMGGWNDDRGAVGIGEFQSATEIYSPGGDSWEVAANMLVAKGDAAAAVYRGMVFAVGGETWSGRTSVDGWNLNQVPTHDTLALTPDTPPQGRLAADVSGYDSANAAQGVAELSGGRGVWTPMAPVPAGRFRFAAATTDDSQALWVFGGTKDNGEVVDSVLAYYDTWHPKVFIHYRG